MDNNDRLRIVGKRILAGIIDLVLINIVVSIILFFVFLVGFIFSTILDSIIIPILFLLVFLFMFVLSLFYYLVCEVIFKGKTLGKYLVGIKVVNYKNKNIGWVESLIRNLLRVIDILPNLYLLAVILVSVTQDSQRVGDMVANTYVIEDKKE